MLKLLSQSWWTLILRGLLGIGFGLVLLSWPVLTIAVLVLLFGAYALVDGVLLILHAISGWEQRPWLMVIEGLVCVGIGLFTLRVPQMAAVGLLFYIAARSLVIGVFEMVEAFSLRREVRGEVWLLMSGLASLIFGFLLIAAPAAGALAVVWIIATYAIVYGALLIALGFRVRGAGRRLRAAMV